MIARLDDGDWHPKRRENRCKPAQSNERNSMFPALSDVAAVVVAATSEVFSFMYKISNSKFKHLDRKQKIESDKSARQVIFSESNIVICFIYSRS